MPTPYYGPAVPSSDPYGKAVKYTFSLKSRWAGDINELSGVHLRVFSFSDADKTLFTDGTSTVDAGNTEFYICPYNRGQLSHSAYAGISIVGGTGYVKVTPTNTFKSFAVFVKPNNTSGVSRISFGNGTTGQGAITFTKAAGANQYTVGLSGTSGFYINGQSVSNGATAYFPYPRLIVASLTSAATDIRFGNAYTDSDAAELIQFDNVATMSTYSGGTQVALTAGEAALYTDLFYRKPTVAEFTETAFSIGGDSIVPNPESWPVVSSS